MRRAASTPTAARSPSSTAATGWTRRCCCRARRVPALGRPPDRRDRRRRARELDHDGLLLRYRPEVDGVDGLPGGEGAFLACTFWLADALHRTGRTGRARKLFDRLLDLRYDLGLLSEEYDTTARRQVGNTPQAFSHVALVNTALALTSGEGR